MAAENVQGESVSENLKKRRGSYLSYLSHPWLKVPKTSKHRHKLSKEDCASLKEKESENSCQTVTNNNDYSDYSDQRDDIFLEDCGNGSSVTGAVNEPFCGGIDGASCTSCVETLCTFSEVQDFSDDPALRASQIAEDLEENRMNELLEPDESDSLDSSVKITELSSSHDPPLYAGSPVKFSVSLLLIITFAMRHNLTGLALADLLTLVNVHLLVPNSSAKSTAVLNSFFRQLKKHIEYHYYCSFCYQYIGLQKITCCSNKHCLNDFSKKDALAYFIVLLLVVQLHSLLARLEVPDLLHYPIKRQKQKSDAIEDIFDGQLYNKHFGEDGFLRGTSAQEKQTQVHLSLQINTDGVTCLFQEFCQFNGLHGCPYCLSPGKTVQTSSKGHTNAYPFDDKNLNTRHGEPRTHEQTLKFAAEATKKCAENGIQKSIKGVKGYSWFMFVPKFDIIRGVAIDYMHSTLLGVVKMLLTLWSDKSYKGEPWSVCSRMKEIEERYLKIGPPSCITRLPRSLIANFGHLQASELRTFLLFYSLSMFYFQHYILLVEAIYLLLQDSISPSDIIKASSLLKHFCIRIKELYAARYETFNVHCLLHLTERVIDLRPLWTHSCFCFEDFNGELRSLFHGIQSIEEQIVLAISVQQKIPELVPLLENGSSLQEFYAHLSRKRHHVYKKEKLSDDSNYSIVGNLQNYLLAATERTVVESLVGPIEQVYRFQRLLVEEQLIHSKSYKSTTRRNNYTVEFKPGSGKSITLLWTHLVLYQD
ncbi:hypothetical protein P5673_019017 [Acropora cervicornis]|uniref:Transposase domain-containing protein n=1 Tax=Acropora cervicornis TaxID=6130 RepID=A0AAD9QCJ7_ACRCE|nr:hypothetical protein P5673_019017 [Acropora cervicornis]